MSYVLAVQLECDFQCLFSFYFIKNKITRANAWGESHELMLAIAAKVVEAEHPVAHPHSPCQSAMLSNS